MKTRRTSAILSLLALFLLFAPAATMRAGGALEQVDITGNIPSPIPGHVIAPLIPIRWDVRAIPVKFVINDTLDPIPNPLGAAFLSVAEAQVVIESSFAQWNQIPTSYIRMNVVGTTNNPDVRGFDFRNELTFRTSSGFSAIASSPSTSLIADTMFTAGLDIDEDGDSDVSASISVTTDVDSDGDLEFPAGFYKAGTILDNDIQFNTKATTGMRFTTADSDVDTVARSVDLMAIAVHESGHSFGLSHVLNNQDSDVDGNGATMFPFLDTGDPAAELAQRTPNVDDIAWASYFYPEGSSKSGLAAIQTGDVAFKKVFGLIRGTVTHGVLGEPVAGASVFTVVHGGVAQGPSGLSGRTQLSRSASGGLYLIDPSFNILDGSWVIPVPKGNWNLGVEAMDAAPVPGANVSLTAQIGGLFGQLNFNESFYAQNKEGNIEVRPGQRKNIAVVPGKTVSGIDFVTNRDININNFGTRDFIGFTAAPAGRMYAVRVPASQLAGVNPGEEIWVTSALFETNVLDASVPALFARAMLATGTVDGGGAATIDLATPLAVAEGFLAQDNDFAPMYFPEPQDLGRTVRALTDAGTADLFMILQLPITTPFPGVSGTPPLIGLDGGVSVNDVPIYGLSYTSSDGVTWSPVSNFNFRFSLVITEPPM